MRRANILIVILLAALLLIACGKDDPQSGLTTTQQPAAATATTKAPQRSARDGCRAVPAPAPATNPDRRRPRKRLDRGRVHVATLRTNCGTIRIRLAVGRAPKTTASFAALVRSRFFDGLAFHRIAKPGGNDFVIQGGDPLGDGNGGPGYTVVERPPRDTRYRRYDVAMAKTQAERAGTSGSQFFIVTAADAPLDPDFAILGEVVGGKRIVNRIAALATDPVSETPIDPVVISRARITSSKRG